MFLRLNSLTGIDACLLREIVHTLLAAPLNFPKAFILLAALQTSSFSSFNGLKFNSVDCFSHCIFPK